MRVSGQYTECCREFLQNVREHITGAQLSPLLAGDIGTRTIFGCEVKLPQDPLILVVCVNESAGDVRRIERGCAQQAIRRTSVTANKTLLFAC